MWRRAVLLGTLAWLGLSACSADAVDEPEATLVTPGAFAARLDPEAGNYRLFRVLYALNLDATQRVLFLTRYAPASESLDAAARLAREATPPTEIPVMTVVESDFVAEPWRVVWYRTLTDEERDLVL